MIEQVWSESIFIGEWAVAEGGTVDVDEPATGEILYRVGCATGNDVARSAEMASVVQKQWVNTDPHQRSAVFHKAATWLENNADELTQIIIQETGSIPPKAQLEIHAAITMLRLAGTTTLEPNGLTLPSTPGRISLARRLPIGVVGVISPFNFPLVLSLRAVAPALAVGNAVVVKPDIRTPFTGGFIIALALQAGGLPAGLLHVLPGDKEVGEALVTDPNTGMIAFTGSTAAGRRVGELAGKHLKKVSLELGGKNSLIILDDADLDLAASNVAWGSWLHQGQICMTTGRVLVHQDIAEDLTQRVAEKARHLPVGNPATEQVALGPLISQSQLERCHGIVQDTISAGARLEVGGTYEGLFYKPTLLSGVSPGMRSFNEEIFGPVASIISFQDDGEAVALANDTEYGLCAAIISPDIARAQVLGERLDVGMLHINDQTVNDEVINPFSGRGSSGNGAGAGAPAYWEQFTEWQWLTIRNEPPKQLF